MLTPAAFGSFLLLLHCLARCQGQELIAANPKFPQLLKQDQARQEKGGPGEGNQSLVAGYFIGSWQKSKIEPDAKDLPLLYRPTGAVFLQIETVDGRVKGIQNIKGQAVLRDGERYSEDNVLFDVRGVYIEANQRLHGIMESTAPGMRPELDAMDYEQQTPAYREALRGLYGHSWLAADRHEFPAFQRFDTESPMVKRCEFVLDLAFSPVDPALGSQKPSFGDANLIAQADHMSVNGSMESSVCGLSISLNGTMTYPATFFAKATNYALMVISLTFLQTMLLLRQIECSNTQAQMSSVSLLTIGQQAIIDAYLCLLHLTEGMMVDSLFNAMATAAFFEFVIFAVFEMRYMLNIWKSRQGNLLDSRAQQRQLLRLYAKFYLALLCSIVITYQAQRFMKIISFGIYSFWVPQIVSTAYQDTRQPLRPFYVLGISVTRMMLPLYLYGCPQNILQLPISPAFCITFMAFMASQVLILLGQQFFGPRFFIPKQFLPPKYDYFRRISNASTELPSDVETGEAGLECVICMNPVDVDNLKARMLTPCNHVFHTACLQRWMLVKMECPTCRTTLPPE